MSLSLTYPHHSSAMAADDPAVKGLASGLGNLNCASNFSPRTAKLPSTTGHGLENNIILAPERQDNFAMDLVGKFIGPFPIDWFMDKFMRLDDPTLWDAMPQDVEFSVGVVKKEHDLYKYFVSVDVFSI